MQEGEEDHWMSGRVVATTETPRPYVVNNGLNQDRRHRIYIKPAATKIQELQATVNLRKKNLAPNIPSTPQSSGHSLSKISTRRSVLS